MTNPPPRIIIIGAGFGGLFAAREFAKKPVDVLLVDRNNYHTFTPLLYQVATCALNPSEIAYPIRNIFRDTPNVRFMLGTVTAVDEQARTVEIISGDKTRHESYDYLILATGSTPTYFGNDQFRPHSFELRTLTDALELRNHVLRQFEKAAWSDDDALRRALTTIVVVGGGPTGIETAGALYELYSHILGLEYHSRRLTVRVVLVEMQPHLLAPYPDDLRQSAVKQLRSLGVEVLLETAVTDVGEDCVRLSNGTEIPTHTLVWAAGVKSSPVSELIDVPLVRGGKIPIQPTIQVQDRERIYAVGDMAYLPDPDGNSYPMVIPVAQQQAQLAAQNILAQLNDKPLQTFTYHDRGMMATIGRRRAVAYIYNKIPLKGFIAWLAWLALHLITLLGFRSRLVVLINWVWNYFTYDRSVRLIVDATSEQSAKE